MTVPRGVSLPSESVGGATCCAVSLNAWGGGTCARVALDGNAPIRSEPQNTSSPPHPPLRLIRWTIDDTGCRRIRPWSLRTTGRPRRRGGSRCWLPSAELLRGATVVPWASDSAMRKKTKCLTTMKQRRAVWGMDVDRGA